MPSRHRRRRPDLDEKFGLPGDTDPDDVLRRLLGVEGHPLPVKRHEDQEDPDREDETEDS